MPFVRGPARFRKQLFLNFKGGTGKTTLSAAYGLKLAELGYRVLFIDIDPQGQLTNCVGKNEWRFDKTLYHVLIHDEPITGVTQKIFGLSAELIPANISLSATELSLGGLPYRECRLLHALATVKEDYEVVIMDTSPSVSILNLNAILAAKDLIIPVLPNFLSLHGLKTLTKTLALIKLDFEYHLENIGIVLNQFVPGEELCLEIQGALKNDYADFLLQTTIRLCPQLAKQPLRDRFGSRYALPQEAAEDIQRLIEEISPQKR